MVLFSPADLLPVSLILFFLQTLLMIRYSRLPWWLYEHRDGADRGVRKWSAEEQVWWRLHKRQQWYVLDFKIHFSVVSSPMSIISPSPPILQSAYAYVSWHLLPECSFIHQHVEADTHRWCVGLSGALPFLSCNSQAINLVALWLDASFQSLYLLSGGSLGKGRCIRCYSWCNWHFASPYQLLGYG